MDVLDAIFDVEAVQLVANYLAVNDDIVNYHNNVDSGNVSEKVVQIFSTYESNYYYREINWKVIEVGMNLEKMNYF